MFWLLRAFMGLACFFGMLESVLLAVDALTAESTAWPGDDWQTASPESQEVWVARLEKLRDWLKQSGAKAGLVARHGRIVGEWYFDDATPESRYQTFSLSKSLSSTAAGLAIADGKLTLDSKVGEFLPDVSPSEKKEITIRSLLSMTSGVKEQGSIRQHEHMFDFALKQAAIEAKPGEKWLYNNTGLSILSPLLRQATGEELDQTLKRRVFEPIGVKSSDWTWEQHDGHPLPFSGLFINARALARIGLVALHEGKWQDKQVLPEGWIAKAVGPSQDLNKNYGYLWWNNSQGDWPGVPADAFAACGAHENLLLVVPSLDLIAIRLIGDDSAIHRNIDKRQFFRLAAETVTAPKEK